jgi:hypothetical protein
METRECHELVSLDELTAILRRYQGPPDPRRRPSRGRTKARLLMAVVIAAGAIGVGLSVWLGGGEEAKPAPIASPHRRGASSASCADTIVWQGRRYAGRTEAGPLSLGKVLGVATVPACSDVVGTGPSGTTTNATPAQLVTVVAIVGRDPQEAVAVEGRPLVMYVAVGG